MKAALCIAIALLGLYVGIWLCLIGGIVSVVEGIKATPVDSMAVALGVVRVLCTGITLGVSMFIATIVGAFK